VSLRPVSLVARRARGAAVCASTVLWAAILTLTVASGCDSPFPPASRLESVRVLGAVMDKPLSRPGDTVTVKLIVHDGGAPLDAPRPLSIAWFGGCHNPADDAPGNCYRTLSWLARLSPDELRAKQTDAVAVPASATLGFGLETSVVVPDDLVSTHRPIGGETEPRGLSYLYFAVCQGDLVPFTGERSPVGIPIDCVDPSTGARVGPSRFVSGYVTLRAHETATNENPRLGALAIAGRVASHGACVDDASCPTGEGCSEAGACLAVVPTCAEGDIVDCPSVRLSPTVDEASYEDDDTAGFSPPPPESLWIAYFTTAGQFDGDLQMVVDPSSGRTPAGKYDGEWKVAPGFRGQARVFAIAHDNRGGAAEIAEDVLVR
jgi:hypothetical protein